MLSASTFFDKRGERWLGDPLPLPPSTEHCTTVESFAGVTLAVGHQGDYYTVHVSGRLMAATADRATAIREFWRLSGFD